MGLSVMRVGLARGAAVLLGVVLGLLGTLGAVLLRAETRAGSRVCARCGLEQVVQQRAGLPLPLTAVDHESPEAAWLRSLPGGRQHRHVWLPASLEAPAQFTECYLGEISGNLAGIRALVRARQRLGSDPELDRLGANFLAASDAAQRGEVAAAVEGLRRRRLRESHD